MAITFNRYDPAEIKKLAPMVKISAHCNITNPESQGYPYLESIRSFANLCDEVVIVDGGTKDESLYKIDKLKKEVNCKIKVIKGEKWPRNFEWTVMAKNLQLGYENCQYDWAFHFDVDYIFHEDNTGKLKEEIAKAHLPAIELEKVNFVMVYENYIKGHFPLLLNKKNYPALCYGLGSDKKDATSATFLRPISKHGPKGKNGLYRGEIVEMALARLHRVNIPVYTYDFTFMTKEQITEQRHRFENSLRKFRKLPSLSKETAFRLFVKMMRERHEVCRGHRAIKLEGHSKFIRDKVQNITLEQFGHSMFGMYLND